MPKVTKQDMRLGQAKNPDGFTWPEDEGIKMNIYGRSGTGKTTLWATFPKPILALVCSGAGKPEELRSIDTPEYRKTIFPRMITSTDQIVRAADNASEEYATVVLDHGGGLQDLSVKEYLGVEEVPTALYRQAGKGESWSIVSQSGWGQIGIKMKELLRALLNLSCNVVIVCQEREFGGGDEAREMVAPYVASALTPSVTGWLNPACSYICQTFIRQKTEVKQVKIGNKVSEQVRKVKGVEYCLRTAPDPVFTTKFRLPKGRRLPDVIVDPDYDKIMELIQGG